MKLLIGAVLWLALINAYPQTIQNQNQNQSVGTIAGVVIAGGGTGTGIRGVTYTNLTQTTTEQAQNFFAAGGVNLLPNRQALVAVSPPRPAVVRSGTTTVVSSDTAIKALLESREQLAKENARLAGLINNKLQARQSWASEASQRALIGKAIQQIDRQIAIQSLKRRMETAGGRK